MSIEFRSVPRIVCARGALGRLGEICASGVAARRAVIVTDQGIVAAGLLDRARQALAAQGFHVASFADVVADPPADVVEAAAAAAREAGAEIVVGLGGGSAMDVAKLVAVLAASDQPLSEMYGVDKVLGARLPLVQVPTTAGTGSEVTAVAIVTRDPETKLGIVSRQLFADLAVLDAETTVGLPPHVTAATGYDAMIHAIEAYTSRHRKNLLSDMAARQALLLLERNIVRACESGRDIEAREAMLIGAMLAGQAFANAPVAAVHALAYPLGTAYHVSHGVSTGLMLIPVMDFNAPQAAHQYAEIERLLDPSADARDGAATDALIGRLDRIAREIALPRRLSAVGAAEADLPRLAREAMKQTRLLVNNPREVDEAAAQAIFTSAY